MSDTPNQEADMRFEVRQANASEALSQTLDDRTLFFESKRAEYPTVTSSERVAVPQQGNIIYSSLSCVPSTGATVTRQSTMHPIHAHALATPATVDNNHGEQAILAGPVGGEVSNSSKPMFPEILMEILNDEAGQDVLRWMPCGTQFCITNYRKFVGEQMEKLFHIKHMSSFVRKLNRWGFVREFVDGNLDIFRHPSFLRDQPTLCRSMQNVLGDRPKTSKPKSKKITADCSSTTSQHAVYHVSPNAEAPSSTSDHRVHPLDVYHHQYNSFVVPPQSNRINLYYNRNFSPADNSRQYYHQF